MMSRILLVEDEETLADALVDSLQEEGLEVQLARNGADAWHLLESAAFDLLLLDLMLPLLDGTAIIDKLQQRGMAKIPIIVITSAANDALGSRKVAAFLEKPITFDVLLKTVHRFVVEQSE